MKKALCLLAVWVLSVMTISAQTLKGMVTNQKGDPIEFANVAVLSSDSSLVAGTVTNQDGHYEIANTACGHIVRISSLGHKTRFNNLMGQTTLNVILAEDAQLMSEIVVKAKLPKTLLKGDVY